MKIFYLTLLLIFVQLITIAQVDSTFWNKSMLFLAESNSQRGWVKIKDELSFTPYDFFNQNQTAFGLSKNDQMILINSVKDDFGYTHYKFQQTYNNIKVEGCEYILHEYNDKITSANGKLAINLNKAAIPLYVEKSALQIALDYVHATKYSWEEYKDNDSIYNLKYPKGELLYAFLQNNGDFSNNNYQLAYRFEINTIEPMKSTQAIYVDVQTGEVFKSENLILSETNSCSDGTTSTLFNGNQYIKTVYLGFPYYQFYLGDYCRGNGVFTCYNNKDVDDPNNNFVNSYADRVAASAHWAGEMTYDYFLNNHNRNSYDDNGAAIYLHTGETGWLGNAWWLPYDKIIILGTPSYNSNYDWVSLDCVGHEFTHGVNQYSAHLGESNEPGALAESFSDIFGTMVEYYATNGNGNYFIGEDYYIEDGKMRDMQNPNSKDDPDTYLGQYWSTSTNQDILIHANCSVQNHWFYLLSEGGVGTNDLGNYYSVQGIGRTKAAAIAYLNLTCYLTSTSRYSDAKNGSIWAAIELYGICSNEVLQTIQAWDAVGVSSIGGYKYDVTVNCTELNDKHNQGISYTEHAIHNIVSNCAISSVSNAQVTFYANNSIRLTQGFKSGTNFHAFIDECLTPRQLNVINNDNIENIDSYQTNEKINKDFDYSESINSELNDIYVYPNPTNGIVNILFKDLNNEAIEIYIYNSIGNLILHENLIDKQEIMIDLTSNSKGLYLIKIIKNKTIYSKKVVLY